MNHHRIQDGLQQITTALREAAPRGWVVLAASYREAGQATEVTGTATLPQSRDAPLDVGAVPALLDAFAGLRESAYDPHEGTWFSARVSVDRHLRVSYSCQYDEEPVWDQPPSAASLLEDLARYPRPEHTWPQWLRVRLRPGGTHVDT